MEELGLVYFCRYMPGLPYCNGDTQTQGSTIYTYIYWKPYIYWFILDSKDPRIDVDQTSIRRESVGSMSNGPLSEGLCYLGCVWGTVLKVIGSVLWMLMFWCKSGHLQPSCWPTAIGILSRYSRVLSRKDPRIPYGLHLISTSQVITWSAWSMACICRWSSLK